MDDAHGVGAIQGRGYPAYNLVCLGQFQRAPLQARGQRASRHIAHYQIELSGLLAEVVDGDDGGMFQRSYRSRLALKASAKGRLVL